MKLKVRQIGNSLGTLYPKQFCEVYNVAEGDIIDFNDIMVLKKEMKKDEQEEQS
tara:strand:- start:2398 stop:2559 length:162 start_codon:yes stop_codon:yes gene_type:complete